MPALVRAAICLALLVPSSGLLLMNATDEASEWHPGAATRSLAKAVHRIEAFINSTAASDDEKFCMCTKSIGKGKCVDHKTEGGRVTPHYHDGDRCCKLTGQNHLELWYWAGYSNDYVKDPTRSGCFETFEGGCCTIEGKEGKTYGVRVEKTLKKTLEGVYRIRLTKPYVQYSEDIKTIQDIPELNKHADELLPCTRFHVGGTCSLHSQPKTQCCCDVEATCIEVKTLAYELDMVKDDFKSDTWEDGFTVDVDINRARIKAVVKATPRYITLSRKSECREYYASKHDGVVNSRWKIGCQLVTPFTIAEIAEPRAPDASEMPRLDNGTFTWQPVDEQWDDPVCTDTKRFDTARFAKEQNQQFHWTVTTKHEEKCVEWVFRRCPRGQARYKRATCQAECDKGQTYHQCRCKKTCK